MAFLENTQVQEQFQVPTPQVDDPPKKKKLWDYMTKKRLYTKSYEDFDTQFSTPEKVSKLYNFLTEKKQYTKTEDDFVNQFFEDVKKKEPAQPIQQPKEAVTTPTIQPSKETAKTSTNGAATQEPTNIPSQLGVNDGKKRGEFVTGDILSDPTTNEPYQIQNGEKVYAKLGETKDSPIPLSKEKQIEQPKEDVITLAKQADDLGKKTIQLPTNGGMMGTAPTEMPDENAIAQSKELKAKIKQQGYDADELNEAFKDFPEDLFNRKEYSKEKLLVLNKTNKNDFYRTVASAKWQSILLNAIKSLPQDDRRTKTALADWNSFLKNQQLAKDYEGGRQHTRDIVNMVYKYVDNVDEQNKILGYLGKDLEISYDPRIKGVKEALSSDPRKKYLTDNELLGLQYYEDINPQLANTFDDVLVDGTKLDTNAWGDNVDKGEQLGLQQQKIKLATQGLSIKSNAINEEKARIAAKGVQVTPEEKEKYDKLNEQSKEVEAEIKELTNPKSKEYGKLAEYNLDGVAQELFGQRHGLAANQGLKFLSGVGGNVGSVINMVAKPFLSDEGSKVWNLGQIGQSIKSNKNTYTTQENSLMQHFAVEETPAFTQQKNAILNDPNLTDEQKIQKGVELLSNNDGWQLVAPSKELNAGIMPLIYGIADTANGLGQFILTSTLLKGVPALSGATKASNFANIFASTFLQSFQPKLTANLTNNEEYPTAKAFLSSSIDGILFGAADKAGVIKKMFSPKSSIGKVINELSDAELNNIIKISKSGNVFKDILNAALSSAKHATPMVAAGVGGSIANDYINNDLKKAEEYFKEGLMQQAMFTLLGVPMGAMGKRGERKDAAKIAQELIDKRKQVDPTFGVTVEMPSEVAKQREGEIITTTATEYTPETKKSGVSIILPKPLEGEVITTKPIEKTTTESIEQITPKEEVRVDTKPIEVSENEKQQKSDVDIEKRMAEIEGAKTGTPESSEFNSLEKEMEKRERDSVFNVPLEKVNDAVDALIQKEKDKPNGYGSFIEIRDARETKEVADRYLNAKKLTDAELEKDFADAVRGNPTTWYADGLKMRESLKEATNRGIDTEKMLEAVTKVYEDAGYDTKTAKSVVATMLKPVFEGSKTAKEEVVPTKESNVPVSETKEAQPIEPTKVEEKKTVSNSLRDKAKQVREQGVNKAFNLPEAKLPDGTQQAGFGGKGLNEAIAKSLEIVADAIDAGKEFLDAAKEGFENIKAYYKDNAKSFDEKILRDKFIDNIAESKEQAEQLKNSWDGKRITEEPKVEETIVNEGDGEIKSIITKEELSKVEDAKKLFEQEGKTNWNEVVNEAITDLAKEHPNLSIEQAAKVHVDRLAALYDAGKDINPNAKDLAIINLAKLSLEKQLSETSHDLNSNDASERSLAILELERINEDLVKVAKAANPRQAGLAFGIRQMLLSTKNGLEIRRMELAKKKGEKLSDEEMKFTREEWAKEKRLMEEQQELKEKKMQEDFDAQLKIQEDKLNQALKDGKSVEKYKNRQQTLKETGKNLADKIRSGKQKGAMADPFLVGKSLNFILDTVADLVEGGMNLAAAIDKFVTDNKIGSRKQMVEDAIFDHISRQEKREKAIDNITELSEEGGTITKDMVLKNAITDFVNSYVNTVELNQVSDVAFKKLKELLPNITKEQLKQAYLKTGEFKIETKKELENKSAEQQRAFNRLTTLENRLAELKKKNDLLKEGNSAKKVIEDEIQKINDKIQTEVTALGKKLSTSSAIAKEGLQERANAHNENIDSLQKEIDNTLPNVSEKEKEVLDNFSKNLLDAKVDYEPLSKLSQSEKLDKSLDKLKALEKQLSSLKKSISKDLFYDLDMALQKIKDRFESKRKDVEQSVMLDQAKKDALAKKKEYERKIAAKEFDETVVKRTLTKTDAELVENQAQLATIESAYKRRAEEFRKQNRNAFEVIVETAKALAVNLLIGMPKTFFKLAVASPMKISQTYLSKVVIGNLIGDRIFNKGLLQRAKEGGESSSLLSSSEGLKAVFKAANEKDLEIQTEKNAVAFTNKATEYENSIQETKDALDAHGEKSKEYQQALNKQNKLKGKTEKALLKSVGDIMYQYIGGSTLGTFWEKFLNRNSQYEKTFGEFGSEELKGTGFLNGEWKKNWFKETNNWKDVADNVAHIVSFVGRSHGALKSISARYHFAAGFMARLEAGLMKGEDITQFDKLKEYAADAYVDWESGMYQQENWVTTKGNEIINNFKRSDKRAARIVGNLLSWDVAITKVPVNMINEAVIEMTLGVPLSMYKYGKEYSKASREAKAEVPIRLTEADKKHFREVLSDKLSKIDKKEAVAIVRMFRHGGLGLGLAGLAIATGAVSFGGFPHKGQKKEDKKKGEDELKTGDIDFGDTRLNHYMAVALEHTTSVFPTLAFLQMKNNYEKYQKKSDSPIKSASKSTLDILEHIVNSYPQAKIVNPVSLIKTASDTYFRAGQRAAEAYSFGLYTPETESSKSSNKRGTQRGTSRGTTRGVKRGQ